MIEKLEDLLGAEDFDIRVPYDGEELLSYAKERDEDCCNVAHRTKLYKLVGSTQFVHPALHDYLVDSLHGHLNLCKNHPRKVIQDFHCRHERKWKFVVALSQEADQQGYLEGDSDRNNWDNLADGLKELIRAELKQEEQIHGKYNSKKRVRRARKLGSEVGEACKSFSLETGEALRYAERSPRADVDYQEMREWLHYLHVCDQMQACKCTDLTEPEIISWK